MIARARWLSAGVEHPGRLVEGRSCALLDVVEHPAVDAAQALEAACARRG